MKKITYTLLLTFFSLIGQDLNAQAKKLDSLVRQLVDGNPVKMDSLSALLKNAKNDSVRLRLYHELCIACDVKDNLKYAQPMVELADKLLLNTRDTLLRKKILKEKVEAFNFIYIYYNNQEGSKSVNSLIYLKKALAICEEIKYGRGIVSAWLAIADYYSNQGNILKELESLQEGLKTAKKLNLEIGMHRFLAEITFVYASQGDTTQALNYLQKSIELEKQIGDSTRLADSYYRTGNMYFRVARFNKAIEYYNKSIERFKREKKNFELPELYYRLGETYKEKHELTTALDYFQKSFSIGEEQNDLKNIFLSIVAIGQIYNRQGNFEKAIERHKYALKLGELSKLDEPIIIACSHLAQDYLDKKDYRNAKKYSELLLATGKGRTSVGSLFRKEKLAYKIDSASNNLPGAYLHFRNYISLKDQLNGEEVHKAAARERFQNDLEKQKSEAKAEQDKKDVISNEEKQKQNIIIYSISAGLFLVLLLVIFIFRGYRLKQKANTELLTKNDIIAHQKHLVEEKHKEITDSINYAERIQRSFLATKELLDKNLASVISTTSTGSVTEATDSTKGDYFIFFKPKDVVSGDFYCAATLSNGNFALVTADSTGHGVPGAIMSLLNITSLEKAIEYHTNPAEILNHTRKTIINRLKKDGSAEGGKDGMDCSLIVFDRIKNELQIAAAHNPVWIIRTSTGSAATCELIEIKADKMPVGKHDKDQESFTLHTIHLQKGDLIYTMTDGFSDQFGGPNGKKFMSKNLKELLLKNCSLSMDEQKKLIELTFQNWISTYEQVDDVTLIGIRV